ncbi:excalibur calcium-binding domain-containing protein [Pseudochelatococcus contaminans]|uniref:excalibur calcium-binding domain-containing protein n=1 Tax=Pseudochelatococcus contaminans TaxID=1538103 RepID=UPI00160F5C40|nr:excalibur calcium-binding domain-containing protein [Pseudochelatococcus contaminans]
MGRIIGAVILAAVFISPTSSHAWTCKQARSCDEAVREWCAGYARADRDNDGIPCENVCKSRAQVEAAKKRGACGRF